MLDPRIEDAMEKIKNLEEDMKAVKSLLRKLLSEGTGKMARPPGFDPGVNRIVHSEVVPEIEHVIERPLVRTNEKTLEGRLITLALRGWFREKRKIAEISAEFTRMYSVSVNMRDLKKAITKVVQLKILEREKTSAKAWVYWLVPGAQERIKEAE